MLDQIKNYFQTFKFSKDGLEDFSPEEQEFLGVYFMFLEDGLSILEVLDKEDEEDKEEYFQVLAYWDYLRGRYVESGYHLTYDSFKDLGYFDPHA